VVPLTTRGASAPETTVVEALRANGVDASWPFSKAARLALKKSVGTVELAVASLNAIGVLAPSGGAWTADILRKVV
jgi:hypothetical protein